MWLFGKSAAPAAPAPVSSAEAIQKQRAALDTLEKRVTFLEKRIVQQDDEASTKARNKDKRGALMALKRKKMLNTEIDTLNNSRVTLEQQIMTLEAAQTQNVAIAALQTGVQAQQNLNQQMNVDQVDQLMEDMQEQQDRQKEIQEVLGQGSSLEDDDLLDELAALEEAEFEAQAADMAPIPTGAPAQAQPAAAKAGGYSAAPPPVAAAPAASDGLTDEERRELAELQAEMS